MNYPFTYNNPMTNDLLDLFHIAADKEFEQAEERAAEEIAAQTNAAMAIRQLSISRPIQPMTTAEKTCNAAPAAQEERIIVPYTEQQESSDIVNLTYHPRRRAKPPKPPLKDARSTISMRQMYAIWESIFVKKLTFTETAIVANASRSTCYKYAKKFSGNPPMAAIAQENPAMYARIIEQQARCLPDQ